MKRLTRKEKAKVKAIASLVLAAIGVVIMLVIIVFGISQLFSDGSDNKAKKDKKEPVAEETVVEEAKAEEAVVEEEAEPVVEEPAFVEEESYEPEEEETEEIKLVANDKARIRKGPSTDDEVLGNTAVGDVFVKVEDAEDGWVCVVYNGENAYIKGDYLEIYTGQELKAESENAEAENNNEEATANKADAAAEANVEAAKAALK